MFDAQYARMGRRYTPGLLLLNGICFCNSLWKIRKKLSNVIAFAYHLRVIQIASAG